MEFLTTTVLSTVNVTELDGTAFTFFIGCMAMMAASAFFFLEMGSVDKAWRLSVLISGLITLIAAVHYYYMRDFYIETGESPTFFRYVDWILTVPLMCVEFYLILRKSGAKTSLLQKLIFASVAMLVLGYIGEGIYKDRPISWVYGALSGAAYFYIVWLVFKGEVAKLAKNAGGNIAKANSALAKFVLIGWAIYPIGYILGTKGGFFGIGFGIEASGVMDLVYNIGDAINKIGFGLVIYVLAKAESETSTAK